MVSFFVEARGNQPLANLDSFCMYRLRTADKGRPLIISDKVISEYSDGNVDTLHKKNLLSLGEDRYLTTLMMKHFPNMSYRFVASAKAWTAAPEEFSVLLSQRRRWINSTIHNLAELVFLRDMCGFCCFSMRFVVFIDLFGTLILPATCAYLGYLIYMVASHTGQFPLISIVMLAAVYGLQAVIFIIKRQWQHIGWMVIYIIAFPIYSFLLPIYSFWKQDDFSWGSTRLVVEEKGAKKLVAIEADEGFDPRSVPLERWDDYATRLALPGRRGFGEKFDEIYDEPNAVHLDEIRSSYSGSKGPGSVYGGAAPGYYPSLGMGMGQSPLVNRGSMYSLGNQSALGMPGHVRSASYGSNPDFTGRAMSAVGTGYPVASTENLMPHGPMGSTPNLRNRQSMGFSGSPGPVTHSHLSPSGGLTISRPQSTVNFMDGPRSGPSDAEIIQAVRESLRQVDLEQVTKKHLVTLAEQKLQVTLQGDRKIFLKNVIDRELEAMPGEDGL
jgi:chitin synthase